MLHEAVTALTAMRGNLDKVYYRGESLPSKALLALPDRAEGSFDEILDFAANCGGEA
jgi:hypothetical protein